jgi:rhodanese-related sulfurtransferase
MDGQPIPVSPADLYTRLGTASSPVLIDVRRDDTFGTDDKLIIGAFHRRPDDVEHWLHDLPSGRPVVVYCGHGHEISQGIATTLRSSSTYRSTMFRRWPKKGRRFHTTSRAPNLDTSEISVHSTRSYGFMKSRTPRSTIWQGSSGVRIRRGRT